MADSLSTRVSQIVIGNVHALLDRIEDKAPEASMEQAIRKVDEVIEEVRAELGKASANKHLAQRQHAELNTRHAELSQSAENAVELSRDDLAAAAIEKQLSIEAQLPVVESSLQELGRKESDLSGYVSALLGKKREMEEALSQYRASRAAQASANTSSGAGAHRSAEGRLESATSSFSRVFERQTGLSVAKAGISVEQTKKLQELDDLVQKKRIEERLAAIKAGKQ